MKDRLVHAARRLLPGLVVAGQIAVAPSAVGAERPGVDNPDRARFNYMMNCQGCHGARGAGTHDGAVPTMENYVANFLAVDGGREFLLRVPGVSSAPVSDVQLAELTNWMLYELSPDQVPDDFEPYTAAEVAHWRAQPLRDVAERRVELVKLIEARQD